MPTILEPVAPVRNPSFFRIYVENFKVLIAVRNYFSNDYKVASHFFSERCRDRSFPYAATLVWDWLHDDELIVEWFARRLDWIDANCLGDWSVSVQHDSAINNLDYFMNFTFSDPADASHFYLFWK